MSPPAAAAHSIPGWALGLIILAYMAVLFWVATRVDRRTGPLPGAWPVWVYGLSLGVYCTSWTLFGAAGSAARAGWMYLPIYLGPLVVHLLLPGLYARMIAVAKRDNIASIADFLSARYGKNRAVAVGVTVAVTIAALPYLALQLKSVGLSFTTLTSGGQEAAPGSVTVLAAALFMAAFAILFGTRHADASRRNPGLIAAMAVESAVKLVALLILALFALNHLDQPAPATPIALGIAPDFGSFLALTGVAMLAALCLPRQFHVGVVEADGPGQAWRGGQIFGAYLALVALAVVPVALAGLARLPGGNADLYVLTLPLAEGRVDLAVLAFLGGWSASMGMVVIATLALSSMITNELLVPTLMPRASEESVTGTLKGLRRTVIVALMLAAFGLFHLLQGRGQLAEIGEVAFAATAQIGPMLIAGLFWKGAHRTGALAGLAVGMALWTWTLAVPLVLGPAGIATLPGWVTAPGSWLNPQGLFGLSATDPYTQGVLWSLGLNALTLVLVSRAAAHRLTDRTQAARFVTPARPVRPDAGLFAGQAPLDAPRGWGRGVSHVTKGELRALAGRFVGDPQAETAFCDHGLARGQPFEPDSPADAAAARMTERLLSGAIGAASARLIVANALADTSFSLEDVASLLDDTSQELQFSRELLQAALENIQQGVSVVDRDLRIVAWNTPYLRLFGYPEDLVRVGRPIADVIRLNAERGWCGPGDIETHVQRRLEHLTAGQAHSFERRRPDGVVIQSHGQPIPGGGYVMSFSDITRERQREEALADLASRLEARVAERTAQLEAANVATETAREAAEQANASKTRFLAAASHDLLQPLNAARLFLSAAREDSADPAGLLTHVDRAIQSADRLIRTLLDISKLDHGKITPEVTVVPLEPLFAELCEELRPRAEAKGLRLRYAPTRMTVRTDRVLLRSVLQNFLSNAVRYTRQGGVLIGARPLGREVRIGVWDTGPGVPTADRAAIFEEFRRLPATASDGDGGVGLGLAIVTRIARLIGGHVELESVEGQGSQFSIRLLRGDPGRALHLRALRRPKGGEHRAVQGMKVLCIDDQPGARDGLAALLSRWGCRVATSQDLTEAHLAWDRLGAPDAVVADYHLAGGATGLQAIAALRARGPFLAVLLTADAQRQTRDAAIEMGVAVTLKPLDPAVLKALLARARVAQPG